MAPSMAEIYSISAARANDLFQLSQDTGGQLSFVAHAWADQMTSQLVETILSSVLFGIYTIIAVIATYLQARKGFKNITTIIMLCVILIIYSSTLVYWIILLCEAFRQYRVLIDSAVRGAINIDKMMEIYHQVFPKLSPGVNHFAGVDHPPYGGSDGSNSSIWWRRSTQECVGTASLTVNVVLGDAIVWWRAWVLWKSNRVVRVLCVVLILATFVTGVIATTDGCNDSSPFNIVELLGAGNVMLTPGSFYTGDQWGVVTSALSLFTNGVATSLIAWKAWSHRKLVKDHLRKGSKRTRVERVLTLLVESGILYCALWAFVVAYQSESYTLITESAAGSYFVFGFHYFVEGCLISLIGIYPTLIIILVAVDQSHVESSFTYGTMVGGAAAAWNEPHAFPTARVVATTASHISFTALGPSTSHSLDDVRLDIEDRLGRMPVQNKDFNMDKESNLRMDGL